MWLILVVVMKLQLRQNTVFLLNVRTPGDTEISAVISNSKILKQLGSVRECGARHATRFMLEIVGY